MKRYIAALLLLLPASAFAQASQSNWDNLKELAPGQQIKIVLNGAKAYKAEFQSVSDDAIVVRLAPGDQTFERQNILRVSTKGRSHRLRNALIGAGIGGGVVAAGLGACSGYREVVPCGGTGAGIGAGIGGAWGGVIGAVVPTGGWHDVYRAR